MKGSSGERQVASATRPEDTMLDGDAQAPHGSAACAAAAPAAAPRRVSGALSEAGCAAQPAEHTSPDEALGGGGGPRRHRAPRRSAETGLRLYESL